MIKRKLIFPRVSLNWLNYDNARNRDRIKTEDFGMGTYKVVLIMTRRYAEGERLSWPTVAAQFCDMRTDEVLEEGAFKDLEDFISHWDIIGRRVLVEKSGTV